MKARKDQIAAARRFDSRWRFESGYANSPFLPKSMTSASAYADLSAKAAMHASGADFAIVSESTDQTIPFLAPGEARIADAAALEYGELLCMEELTGEEILRQVGILRNHGKNGGNRSRFAPAPDPAKLEPKRSYRVALPQPWVYLKLIVPSPPTFRETDITLREMILRGM